MCVVFRVFSNPPQFVNKRVRRKRYQGVRTGGRSGVDARLGFEDPFTLVAVMREISSVEPTIAVWFCGVVVGCECRGSIRGYTSLFGQWVRRRRSK